MASSTVACQLTRIQQCITRPWICSRCLKARRNFTMKARSDRFQDASDELEQLSSLGSRSEAVSTSFDPLRASRDRKKQLPPSRYGPLCNCILGSPATPQTHTGSLDTNSDLQSTIGALSILTNRRLRQIHPQGFSCQALSLLHPSSRLTIVQ